MLKKTVNDIVFIIAVFLIAATALACYTFFRPKGHTVVITVNGQVYANYSLDKNITAEIISEDGKNLLVIKDGKAEIYDATCPDLICVQHRAISKQGDVIACLPNKVVVSIE